MPNFAEVLERYRRARGFSQATLARHISKSPQYVSALERQKGAQFPSVETLRRLVTVLAQEEESDVIDWQAAADLTLAGIGLNYPFEMPLNIEEELDTQGSEPEGSQFWIMSDVLAEAESKDFARITADSITQKSMRYTYFVSFGNTSWKRAIGWLQEFLASDILMKHVTVYQISDCMFTSRLRITNPRGDNPSARYSLGAKERIHLKFYPAPVDLLVKAINVLHELVLVEEAEGQTLKRKPFERAIVGTPEKGFVRRVFPERP